MRRGRRRRRRRERLRLGAVGGSCRVGRVRCVLLAAALAMMLGRPAAAATEDWTVCEAAGIAIKQSPSASWRAAVLELCREYRSIPDLDPGATIQLQGSDNDVLVSVWLRDGRSAERRIHSPAALRGAVEALVVVPPARAP